MRSTVGLLISLNIILKLYVFIINIINIINIKFSSKTNSYTFLFNICIWILN